MAFFEFPHTRTYDSDLGWLIKKMGELIQEYGSIDAWKSKHEQEYRELANKVDGLIGSLVDVIVPWDSSVAYRIFSIVEYQGTNYIAVQDVPVGTMITNTDYWQPANTVTEQINAIAVITSQLQQEILVDTLRVHCPYKGTAATGDCTIFQCGTKNILVDLGMASQSDAIISYMVNNGLTKYDAVIFTHYHSDHAGGYLNILSDARLDFSDAVFYLPPVITQAQILGNESYIALQNDIINYLASTNAAVVYPENNTITEFGDLKIRWLNISPAEWQANGYYTNTVDESGTTQSYTSMNNFSMVLDITHGRNSLLWAGDLEALSEGVVAPYLTVSPYLYKWQHHGVNVISNDAYSAKINPKYSIIQGIGFLSQPARFANNPFTYRMITDNRSNIYTLFLSNESVVFESNGVYIIPVSGKSQVVNNALFTITGEAVNDKDFPNGVYRINGLTLDNLGGPRYGVLFKYGYGTIIIQMFVDISNRIAIRSYDSATSAWGAWKDINYVRTADGVLTSNLSSGSVHYQKRGNMVVGEINYTTVASPVDGSYTTIEAATGLPVPSYPGLCCGVAIGNYVANEPERPVLLVINSSGSISLAPRGNGVPKTGRGSFVYYTETAYE